MDTHNKTDRSATVGRWRRGVSGGGGSPRCLCAVAAIGSLLWAVNVSAQDNVAGNRVFRYRLVESPSEEAGTTPTRNDDVADTTNALLTEGLRYRFRGPGNSDDATGFAEYFPEFSGTVT